MIGLRRVWIPTLVLAVLVGATWSARPATQAAAAPAAPPVSTLVAIRAASHPEATPRYERVVFQFDGPVPLIEVNYVKQLIGGASGLPVAIRGNAVLELTMRPAKAHNEQGQSTAATRFTLGLRNIKEVAGAGDFEAVLGYGIGLAHKAEIRVITLDQPSRVVVDFLDP